MSAIRVFETLPLTEEGQPNRTVWLSKVALNLRSVTFATPAELQATDGFDGRATFVTFAGVAVDRSNRITVKIGFEEFVAMWEEVVGP